MKNLLQAIPVILLVVACNPTKNELHASRKNEKKSGYTSHAAIEESSVKSELYASTKRTIVINESTYDSLQRSPMGDQQKLDKDRTESSRNLKKSLSAKISKDTVYHVKGGWYAVE